MYWGGRFSMYVSATRLGDDGHGVEAPRRQGLARSDRPEGPYVLDDEPLVPDAWSIDGHYRDASYGIGLATAELPRGPWRKSRDNPILRSGERITGPGHHSMILAPDGVTTYAVYHGYDGAEPGRKAHLDPVHWAGERPLIGTDPVAGRPTEGPQPRPPGPVHDPAVPYWHADVWGTGDALHVDGVRIPLDGAPGPWRVRVNQGRLALRTWVDGRLRTQASGLHAPELRADGEILAMSLTSHLSDEAVRWIAPGERFDWPWGGGLPIEVRLAVRGACRLEAGGCATEVRSPLDRYALARLDAPHGADEIWATGMGRGARITDLVVTARTGGPA